MKPNLDKIDDAVLALLHLTSFTDSPQRLDVEVVVDVRMATYRRACRVTR